MYVKIRTDGAVGIGRGTPSDSEIALGYGEAHMIAAALEKLAQTARNYKQTYKKTTDVGSGNKIEFERSDEGMISVSGDGQTFMCTEDEIRELARLLKNLPPIEVAPSSDYAHKIPPDGAKCVVVKNGSDSIKLRLPEAALLKVSLSSSLDSKFFEEHIHIGQKELWIKRSSDLKWALGLDSSTVKFTAYEVENLSSGLHNAILDVLMDLVKSMGTDKLADIRIKSQIQRIEQDTLKLLGEHKKAKSISKDLTKMSKKVLESGIDAEERTQNFIKMCQHVYSNLEPSYLEPLFDLFSSVFVADS
ncbi:MAG: hypothetical protein BAJATHORv1_50212 [Candidatus Thorarchaeota archaeon]|nr:MAG: hypothetical protein BAJATHORv1_50212 [Candidatus Thorarchaeota archaeon]